MENENDIVKAFQEAYREAHEGQSEEQLIRDAVKKTSEEEGWGLNEQQINEMAEQFQSMQDENKTVNDLQEAFREAQEIQDNRQKLEEAIQDVTKGLGRKKDEETEEPIQLSTQAYDDDLAAAFDEYDENDKLSKEIASRAKNVYKATHNEVQPTSRRLNDPARYGIEAAENTRQFKKDFKEILSFNNNVTDPEQQDWALENMMKSKGISNHLYYSGQYDKGLSKKKPGSDDADIAMNTRYMRTSNGKSYIYFNNLMEENAKGIKDANGRERHALLMDVSKLNIRQATAVCQILNGGLKNLEDMGENAKLISDDNVPDFLRKEIMQRFCEAGYVRDFETGTVIKRPEDMKKDQAYLLSKNGEIKYEDEKNPALVTRTGDNKFKSPGKGMTEAEFEKAFAKEHKPKMPGLLARIFSSEKRREYRTKQTLFERKLYYAKRANDYKVPKPAKVEEWERRMLAFAHRLVDEDRIEQKRKEEDAAAVKASNGKLKEAKEHTKFQLVSFDKLMGTAPGMKNKDEFNHYKEIVNTAPVRTFLNACQQMGEKSGAVYIDALRERTKTTGMFEAVKTLMDQGKSALDPETGLVHASGEQRAEIAKYTKLKTKENLEEEIRQKIQTTVKDKNFEDAVANYSQNHSIQFANGMRRLCNDANKLNVMYNCWKKDGEKTLNDVNKAFVGKFTPESSKIKQQTQPSAAYGGVSVK